MELGKGQWLAPGLLNRAGFSQLAAGEAGRWRPCQEECSLKWYGQQSVSESEASTNCFH